MTMLARGEEGAGQEDRASPGVSLVEKSSHVSDKVLPQRRQAGTIYNGFPSNAREGASTPILARKPYTRQKIASYLIIAVFWLSRQAKPEQSNQYLRKSSAPSRRSNVEIIYRHLAQIDLVRVPSASEFDYSRERGVPY
jgi:hypothetical protein